jgi:two-component system phosphate regulon response regulator PhoB
MHVQRLRAKLGAAGDLVETVRGFGYRLRAPEPRGT